MICSFVVQLEIISDNFSLIIITDKYKFLAFNCCNLPVYSALRKIEKDSLSKWKEYVNEKANK